MSISAKLTEIRDTLGDKLNDAQWFQEAKGKWEELDPQSRFYIQIGTAGAVVLLTLIFSISFIVGTIQLRRDLASRTELLSTMRLASDESARLRDSGSAGLGSEGGSWTPFFETVAASSGVDKSMLTVGTEKTGKEGSTTKELLFDLTLKHINLKQAVRYAYHLENSNRPVKLRNLAIDTGSDPEGYLDATYSVSAFGPKN